MNDLSHEIAEDQKEVLRQKLNQLAQKKSGKSKQGKTKAARAAKKKGDSPL